MNGIQVSLFVLFLILGLGYVTNLEAFSIRRSDSQGTTQHYRNHLTPLSQSLSTTSNEATEEENNPTVFYMLDGAGRWVPMPVANEIIDMSKRGLDLGLGRGFSGNQAAKSQVGLIAANLPNGPGR